jgi:putative endonuclease
MIESSTGDIGQLSEQAALEFLTVRGAQLVERNARAKFGEIDLIMRDGEFIVFVEVRKRSHRDYGSGADSVQRDKRSKLIKAAKYFIVQHPKLSLHPMRFDVVSVGADDAAIDWIKNAFDAGSGW